MSCRRPKIQNKGTNSMQEKECTKQEVHFAEEAPTYYANFTGIAVGPSEVWYEKS